MNTTGFIRGYMSKNLKGEKFIEHVATCIEQQLQEWDPNYQVQVIHLANYEIVIKNNNVICNLTISKNELVNLQSRSPYALDRFIWRKLKEKGVKYGEYGGNYLTYVFR
ncbi:hypothetical protein [Paucisalibacillus globulus]|uniref:hypothetical protein n=1 Tax=Paucisalibacillus globulus TaxID=351095 RepID=UPI000BB708B5|nr:hypothetical protein [Paucisalibacillus globulus]